MKTYMKPAKYLGVIGLAALASACKVEIAVPPGGAVQTQSGAFSCRAGQTCAVDVVDLFYDETFEAVASPGYTFKGWRKTEGAFCGGSKTACRLVTSGFEGNDALLALLASPRTFYLTPVFEPLPVIKEQDLVVEGRRIPTADGYSVDGTLKIDAGYSTDQELRNARLNLRFDDKGQLLSMAGVSLLPRQLTKSVSVVGDTQALVGLYQGREINNNPEFEITVQDDRQYLAFVVSNDVTLRVDDPTRPGRSELISIGTPLSGKIVFVIDPADEMFYQYGEALGVAFGKAESDQGLLPYIPDLKNSGFTPFEGHEYTTGTVPVGIKVFDLLSLSGSTVVRQPRFRLVDLKDPFNAPVEYQAGFNGSAKFAFGVLGFDLFSFDLAQASASFNVTRRRQAMTLAANIEPDVSWIPPWIPLVPATQLRGDFVATSKGQLNARILGRYRSTVPPADLEGSINMTPTAVTYSGQIHNAPMPLKVSMTFKDRETLARIDTNVDFSATVKANIDQAFDRAEKRVTGELSKLEQATKNYEIELSMRGLRAAIPGITNTAITILNGVPDTVYSEVYSGVQSGINSRRRCIGRVCVPSNSRRDSEASSAAENAESQAQTNVNTQIARLNQLKQLAATADDDTIRAALKRALLEVYDNRRLRKTISVRVSVLGLSSPTGKPSMNSLFPTHWPPGSSRRQITSTASRKPVN